MVEQSFRVRKARSVGDWQGVHRVSWGGSKVEVTSLGARKRGLGATARSPQGELGWEQGRSYESRDAQARSGGDCKEPPG